MRNILLTLLAMGGVGLSGPASAQTATQFPFCIQGVDNPGWSGCSFSTFQECQATASGTEAECLSNPWYKAWQWRSVRFERDAVNPGSHCKSRQQINGFAIIPDAIVATIGAGGSRAGTSH